MKKIILRNDPKKARQELEDLLEMEADQIFCNVILDATFQAVVEIVGDEKIAVMLITDALDKILGDCGDA